MIELTYEEVDAVVLCDTQVGRFWWKTRPLEMFTEERLWRGFNTRCAGKEFFLKPRKHGYRETRILGEMCRASRVCWLLHHGKWPENDLDHENGIRWDDRIANLRDVPNIVNSRNQRRRYENTSGVTGVWWSARAGKWQAAIGANMQKEHLGYFEELADAAAARRAAETRLGYSDRHGQPL